MELSDDFYIPTNEFQTAITKDFLSTLPEEVAEQLLDFVTNVPYIQNLISPNRRRAKDMPHDEEGRVIVDLANPHILEDMDYFRPAALHFKKHGCYTFLRPNPNPNSEYKKWINEEKRRCREGFVRESDGEWITGYMYWYMNYCPIMLTRVTEGKKKADRVEDFPETWEGIYLRFHYIHQARENGHHAIELARRGCSKSYSLASMMAKNLILGESTEVCKRVTTVLTAYQKEYLADKDGTLSKFEPMINFVSENTEFPRLRLRSSSQDMFWQMGYIDNYGRKKGSLNSVMGVSSKDDSGKLRGKRGHIYFEEMGSFPNLLEIFDVVRQGMEEGDYTYGLAFLVGCVCKGTLVCKPNGEQIPIEKLTPEDGIVGFNKESFTLTNEPISNPIKPEPTTCYRITLSNNNILECSWDHPILVAVIHSSRINGTNRRNIYYSYEWKLAKDITHKDKICESRVVGVFGKEKLFDARLIGMLIGDGSYGIHNSIKYSSQDYELQNYIESKYDAICTRGHITKNDKSYKEYRIRGLCQGLRESGIYGQTRTNKRLPSNYQKLDRENTILLLSGLYDTDGTICYKEQRSSLEIAQSNETILKEINILWRKFGVYGSIQKVNPIIKEGRKDKNPWYNLIIAGGENLTRALSVLSPLIGYKKESSTKILNFYKNYQYKCVSNIDKSIVCHHAINVECIGIKEVYHLTTDNTHTYLANGIITHNTAAEKESNFESAKTLLYNTEVYNIHTIKNVYDKPKQGKPTFGYFFPAYVNRKGCYNKDGVSDAVKALVQILMARYKAKYGSDPNSVLRVIAEMPITPAEAIIKVKNAFFPVTALTERLQQIDLDSKAYDDVKVGNLVLEGNEVKFRPSDDKPIRKYGVDNSTQGAIEIYEVPQRNSSNNVYDNRYIIGHDPVDNDQAESHSLSSTFVLDLYTDRIVAEYTGRQPFADDNFEIVRLLCLFYNAKCLYESNKKGIFAYFQKLQCTHLLADTPEYLRDKQMVKYSSFGSNAKGVNASAAINNYANGLIRDWLLKPTPTIIVEDGVEKQVQISNLYFIRSRALLEELIAFDPVRNFDRIRALGMLMLYREEKIILYGSNLNAESAEKADKSYLGNDDFFKRNYDNVGVPFPQ